MASPVGSGISDINGEVEYCFTPTVSGVVSIVCFYQGGDRIEAEVLVTDPEEVTITLIDADTDLEVLELQDGDMFAVEDLPESIALRANYSPDSVGSVVFELVGPFRKRQVENHFPYASFGNRGDDYAGRLFPPGAYQLTVTPYSRTRGAGEAGPAIEINFTITVMPIPDDLAVTGFDLYDATTDTELQELADGDVIDLDVLENNNLTVLIEVMPDFVGSVKTELTGPVSTMRIENNRPYTLFGNNSSNFFGRALLPGSYTLKATPFTDRRATGTEGTPLEITFEVIGGAPPAGLQRIYPMPFQNQFTVENLNGSAINQVQLFDQSGKTVDAQFQVDQFGVTIILPNSGPRQSILIVRTQSEDGSVRTSRVSRIR